MNGRPPRAPRIAQRAPHLHGLRRWTDDPDRRVLSPLWYAAACGTVVASPLRLLVLAVLLKSLHSFAHQLSGRMNQVVVSGSEGRGEVSTCTSWEEAREWYRSLPNAPWETALHAAAADTPHPPGRAGLGLVLVGERPHKLTGEVTAIAPQATPRPSPPPGGRVWVANTAKGGQGRAMVLRKVSTLACNAHQNLAVGARGPSLVALGRDTAEANIWASPSTSSAC
jgi:hypothetical protein